MHAGLNWAWHPSQPSPQACYNLHGAAGFRAIMGRVVMDNQSTFVLPLTQAGLSLLRLFSPGLWLEKLGIFSFWVVDLWVSSWTLAALASYVISFSAIGQWFSLAIVVCGILRILEIVVFHFSELLSFSVSHYRLRSYRRSIVLLLLNYCEIILWFAAFYSLLNGSNQIVAHAPVSVSPLRESISLMVANSTGLLDLRDSLIGWSTVTAQSALGLFLTTVVAARIIGLLPKPATLDPGEWPEGDTHEPSTSVPPQVNSL
jgi:hypothetical protein